GAGRRRQGAIESADGKVLAFCRSGTRSIVTWSIGQALAGEDRETLISQGRQAGYDLSGVLPGCSYWPSAWRAAIGVGSGWQLASANCAMMIH
ncbi:beta-lactamase hydrolase domain-containing protein, partial [Escherichia coli]